jgi:hypothetical protein
LRSVHQRNVLELSPPPQPLLNAPKPTTWSLDGTTEEWSDAKNNRRCDLIDREIDGPPLTPAEVVELAGLQEQMLRYRQRVAPLPIEDARRLHQELLARVAAQEAPK